MANVEERLFMLDLAIVQLIAGILVTLGSTLLAISIGFGLSIPTAMQEAILQVLALQTKLSPDIQQALVQESLTNYVMIVAVVGGVLIVVGVVFASARINKIRRQIREHREINNLVAPDIRKKEAVGDDVDKAKQESIPNRTSGKMKAMSTGKTDRIQTNV